MHVLVHDPSTGLPDPPYKDAGVDAVDGLPDAPYPDAAPCSDVQAELIMPHPNWALLYGNDLQWGHGLTADVAGATLAFTFTGTTLGLNSEHSPNIGSIRVTVDNGAPVIVDGYHPGSTFTFSTTQIASGLANTQHSKHVRGDGAARHADPDHGVQRRAGRTRLGDNYSKV